MAAFSAAARQLLARQHGVGSMDDFTAAGMAPWEVGNLVSRQQLELVLPGAWRTRLVPESDLQRCAAVCRAHPQLTIAGPAAGRLDGGHDVDLMLSVATSWISPRRRWVRRFFDAVDRRIAGPAADSHLEVLLGNELQARGVSGLVRQHEIVAPDHGLIRFDLAVPALRWAVEFDGFSTHREVNGRQADER